MGVIHSTATATIASGQTVGAAFYVGAKVPVSLQMPAAFTGATVSFQGSNDGSTYQAINIGAAAYSETVTASKNVALDSNILAGFPFLRIVSASAEGADRSIIVHTRRPVGG
jgi:hypothetical protein